MIKKLAFATTDTHYEDLQEFIDKVASENGIRYVSAEVVLTADDVIIKFKEAFVQVLLGLAKTLGPKLIPYIKKYGPEIVEGLVKKHIESKKNAVNPNAGSSTPRTSNYSKVVSKQAGIMDILSDIGGFFSSFLTEDDAAVLSTPEAEDELIASIDAEAPASAEDGSLNSEKEASIDLSKFKDISDVLRFKQNYKFKEAGLVDTLIGQLGPMLMKYIEQHGVEKIIDVIKQFISSAGDTSKGVSGDAESSSGGKPEYSANPIKTNTYQTSGNSLGGNYTSASSQDKTKQAFIAALIPILTEAAPYIAEVGIPALMSFLEEHVSEENKEASIDFSSVNTISDLLRVAESAGNSGGTSLSNNNISPNMNAIDGIGKDEGDNAGTFETMGKAYGEEVGGKELPGGIGKTLGMNVGAEKGKAVDEAMEDPSKLKDLAGPMGGLAVSGGMDFSNFGDVNSLLGGKKSK